MHRRKFVQLIATAGAGTLVTAAGASTNASTQSASRTVTFHVKGFSCITCAVGLDTMLKQRKGVASSHSTYPEGVVVIEFDPAEVSAAELRAFISDMGFTVTEER